MPYMTKGVRNYKKEHEWEIGKRGKANRGKPKRRSKIRDQNNKANRIAGTYGNRDGKDVAHKDNNTRNNKRSNLSVQSKNKNRSFSRTKSGRRRRG